MDQQQILVLATSSVPGYEITDVGELLSFSFENLNATVLTQLGASELRKAAAEAGAHAVLGFGVTHNNHRGYETITVYGTPVTLVRIPSWTGRIRVPSGHWLTVEDALAFGLPNYSKRTINDVLRLIFQFLSSTRHSVWGSAVIFTTDRKLDRDSLIDFFTKEGFDNIRRHDGWGERCEQFTRAWIEHLRSEM